MITGSLRCNGAALAKTGETLVRVSDFGFAETSAPETCMPEVCVVEYRHARDKWAL